MFCPICESEYEPGVTRCPDDDVQLVEKLSTEAGASDGSEARFVDRRCQHRQVDADHVLGVTRAEPGGHRRSPIAAVRTEAVVSERGHELDPQRGDLAGVEATFGRRAGEAVAGE